MIDLVHRNPADIVAEYKTQLETILGREIEPASTEMLVINFVAYREVLLLNRFNAAMAQMFVRYSTAPTLDYLAELVAVERLGAQYAGCMLRFYVAQPLAFAVGIEKGTRVSDGGGNVFETLEGIEIPSGSMYADVEAVAEVAGSAANGTMPGGVKNIMNPIAYVSKCENTTVTAGGADPEDDEHLRERILLAPNQYSTAGARFSYEYFARGASTLIQDLCLFTDPPGTVNIAVLLENSNNFAEVAQRIHEACSADDVRPLSDTIVVVEAERIPYDIVVDAWVFTNADALTTKRAMENTAREYGASHRKMGVDITLSQMIDACMVDGVYDVSIVAYDGNTGRPLSLPIECSPRQYAQMGSVTVNIVDHKE